MAALSRPAGPAYSLLRERPGGNEVVGITHQYGPGAEADHRFLHSGLLQARRGHVLGAPRPVRLRLRHFQTRRRILLPLLRPSPVIDWSGRRLLKCSPRTRPRLLLTIQYIPCRGRAHNSRTRRATLAAHCCAAAVALSVRPRVGGVKLQCSMSAALQRICAYPS